MTHSEAYKELEKDFDILVRKFTYWRHELRRSMLKSKTFPRTVWLDYTTPRHNRFLVELKVFDRRMRRAITRTSAIRNTSGGMEVFNFWLSKETHVDKMVFTPHALSRYAERAKVGKTGIELFKHFSSHNVDGLDEDDEKLMGQSVRYNGEDLHACCMSEGVMLGKIEDGVFVLRTFITYDMCTGRQKKSFEQKKLKVRSDEEVVKRSLSQGEGRSKPWKGFRDYV